MIKSVSLKVVLLVSLLCCLLVGIGYYLYQQYEVVEKEIDQGYQEKARRNDYLAAQYFVEKMGLPTASIRSFATLNQLSDKQSVLLLPVSRNNMQSHQAEHILGWVNQGGHLITVIWTLKKQGQTDLLLDYLGVIQQVNDDAAEHDAALNNMMIFEKNQEKNLKINFLSRYYLEDVEDTALFGIKDAVGHHELTYVHGQGLITVLSDGEFLKNDAIGQYDHAEVFWQLIKQGQPKHAIWINYQTESPSLWDWLWQHASELILTLMLMTVMIIWQFSGRLGSVILIQDKKRRSLLEHMMASGRFHWKYQNKNQILKNVQQAVLLQVQSCRPGCYHATSQKQCQQLAALTQINVAEVEAVLYKASIENEHDFIKAIQSLKTIKSKI